MFFQINKIIKIAVSLIVVWTSLFLPHLAASDAQRVSAGNFGLPGIVDLPTALRFPDGELVVTQQLHKSMARSGISFQALPRVGVSFRYTGHGINGGEAYGRVNHDRSFDAHTQCWMREHTSPPSPLDFEILLVPDGIHQSISSARNQ